MTTTIENQNGEGAMTSFESVQSAYERHGQLVAKANELNKAVVFEALAATSITAVIVDFDGEGDSGQIESIAAYAAADVVNLPAATVTTHAAQWNSDKLAVGEQALNEAIEELCYGYLAQEHDGWENNDGAYGEFRFDVRERTIEFEFNGRYTSVHTDTKTL